MSKEVVVAYYGENLDWIKNIESDYNFIVYNKTDADVPNTIKLDNIGRETNTYFHHIVNNYDNLSDWVFFTQGNPIEHVKDYEFILNNFPESLDKSVLNDDECYFFSNGIYTEKMVSYGDGTPHHEGLNINYIWKQLFDSNPPDSYVFSPAAIFCVSRTQIRKRNKQFYEKCLRITEEIKTSPWEFERMMSYVFNNNVKLRECNLENKIFTEETISRWFSSKTIAEGQLQSVIDKNNFSKKIPKFSEISNTLCKCDNLYDNYKTPENIQSTMPYNAHIGQNTLSCINQKLGKLPMFGLEVGSFIGSSAIILGNMMKENNGVLMCIDTWCGDINMWLMDMFHETMNKKDGNPKIYDLFIQNMRNNNLTTTVFPIRVSSVVAARMLKVLNYEIDFVYLDSAHEAGETFMELMLYHDILKNNGVLFGDDYHTFPAVKYDVDLFCNYFNYKLEFTGDADTWIIQKQ